MAHKPTGDKISQNPLQSFPVRAWRSLLAPLGACAGPVHSPDWITSPRPECRCRMPPAARMHATHGGHALEADGVLVGDERVGRVSELKARGPSVVDDVVDLLGDLGAGQGGQVGEGLVLPASEGSRGEGGRQRTVSGNSYPERQRGRYTLRRPRAAPLRHAGDALGPH